MSLGFRWLGSESDDCERGFQADGGGGFEVGEEVAEGGDGEVDEVFDLFSIEERAIVLGTGEGVLEGDEVATPVADGVAVDAGLGGCGGEGGAG